MINFKKLFTAIIGNNISDKEIEKIGKNSNVIAFGKATTAESALASAYIAHLRSQGMALSADQIDDLSSKIEFSLKKHKKKAMED